MDIDQLSEQQSDAIIGSGLELMKAITEAFGPEDGLKTWEVFAETMGNDFKHAIFMAMLTGKSAGFVSIFGDKHMITNVNKIETIKVIRSATGWGLKESKDFVDDLFLGTIKNLKVKFGSRSPLLQDLAKLGIRAS